MLRPYSVTVLQDPEKYELAVFFYEDILSCADKAELSGGFARFFPESVHLGLAPAPADDESEAPYAGGFTGIQLNYVPAKDLNPIVAKQRATGIRQPEPKELGDQRVLHVHDPSGNIIMCVGYDEAPDEPTVETAVGAITVFVSDITAARRFFVDGLQLPVRATPHDGLIVLGEDSGTAVLIYRVPPGNSNTPIGRMTGLAFLSRDPGEVLVRVRDHGGEVVDQVNNGDPTNGVRAATFADPDGNQFTLLSETFLAQVAPDPPDGASQDDEN